MTKLNRKAFLPECNEMKISDRGYVLNKKAATMNSKENKISIESNFRV